MTENVPHRPMFASATMSSLSRCRSCGWGIVRAVCNDGMGKTPPYSNFQWWHYCANKVCENHAGVGVAPGWQPDWEVPITAKEMAEEVAAAHAEERRKLL